MNVSLSMKYFVNLSRISAGTTVSPVTSPSALTAPGILRPCWEPPGGSRTQAGHGWRETTN